MVEPRIRWDGLAVMRGSMAVDVCIESGSWYAESESLSLMAGTFSLSGESLFRDDVFAAAWRMADRVRYYDGGRLLFSGQIHEIEVLADRVIGLECELPVSDDYREAFQRFVQRIIDYVVTDDPVIIGSDIGKPAVFTSHRAFVFDESQALLTEYRNYVRR